MSEWEMVKLGEVATLLNGRAYNQDELLKIGKTPVLRVGNFFSNRGWYYSDLDLDEDKYCDKGDLLYAWSASFGPKIWDGPKVIYHYHIWKVLLTDKVEKKYMFYLLQNKTKMIMDNGHGIAMIHATKSGMEQMQISLPSLETQQKIADLLDKSSSLIELRKAQIEKLDLLIKSKFIDMFGDPVTNPMGWEEMLLKNITLKIGSGATPKGGRESYKSEGISLIRSMNVYNGYFKYDNLAYLDEEQAKQLDIVTLQNKDVLINITGASVARSCMVPSDVLPARVNQHVSIIRCKFSVVNSYYLNHVFINSSYQRMLLSIGTAGGATREAITKQQLEQLNIPIPPLTLQNQFVDIVEQVEQQKAVLHQSLEKLETNYKALMQGCFNGEIF